MRFLLLTLMLTFVLTGFGQDPNQITRLHTKQLNGDVRRTVNEIKSRKQGDSSVSASSLIHSLTITTDFDKTLHTITHISDNHYNGMYSKSVITCDETDSVVLNGYTINQHGDTTNSYYDIWKSDKEMWRIDLRTGHYQQSITRYYFDESNNLTEHSTEIVKDSSIYSNYYTYYDNGLLKSDRYAYTPGKNRDENSDTETRTFTYDTLGRMITEVKTSATGILIYSKECSYKDNIIKTDTHYYLYDKWQSKIEEFNEHGDLIKIMGYRDNSSQYYYQYSYTYSYDSRNNWIKKTSYDDGILKGIETRKIYYY